MSDDLRNCGPEPESGRPRAAGVGVTIGIIAAIGALIAATVYGEYAGGNQGDLLWLDLGVGVLSCALVPLTLRRPVTGTLLLTLLAAVSPGATPPATMGALWAAQRRRFPIAAGVGVFGIAAHAVRGLWRPHGGISFGWWLLLMAAAYAATVGWGALVRAQTALVASLRERARRAEAEQGRRVAEARMLERTRIAREMHDVLAHRLSLLATYAGALEYRPDAPPEQLAQAAGVVRTGVHQALDELRDVISVLRDEDSTDDDFAQLPQLTLADLPRLVTESQDAGSDVRLDNRVTEPSALPAATGRTVYRVVQEGLTNARKHAAGQPVEVLVDGRPGATLVIDIRNSLASRGTITPGTGTGLVGLTERVQLAGGRLDHEITAGREFRLHASLPWPA